MRDGPTRETATYGVKPHPALAGAVLSYFVVNTNAGALTRSLVPAGCVDLVFNLGSRRGLDPDPAQKKRRG